MADLTETQEQMVEIIAEAGENWPLALIVKAPNGADMKVQVGDHENHTLHQYQLAAMYLIFLESFSNKDLHGTAEDIADLAKEMREKEGAVEFLQDMDSEDPF